MSEPQTETDVEPTPGPWELDEIAPSGLMKPIFVESGDATICAMAAFLEPNSHVDPKEALANARLIVVAGTAAQEAKEMGYDPVAVQKALPKILSAAEELLERVEDDCRVRNITPYDEPSFTALEYALKSAEGNDNE